MNTANIKSRIVRIFFNTGWMLAANIISILSGVIQLGMISRLIGPSGVGIIGVFFSITALIHGLFTVQSSELILTFTTKYDQLNNNSKARSIIVYSFISDVIGSLASYAVILVSTLAFYELFDLNVRYRGLFLLYPPDFP